MSDDKLPYSFDLWFDIKSREQLVRHYADTKNELERLEAVMAEHGIEFTAEELAQISPEDRNPPPPSAPKPF